MLGDKLLDKLENTANNLSTIFDEIHLFDSSVIIKKHNEVKVDKCRWNMEGPLDIIVH